MLCPQARRRCPRAGGSPGSWQVGTSAFLAQVGQSSEAAYKRAQMEAGRIMRHAQIGYRDLDKSCQAYAEIYEACERTGFQIDRYGLCLDWSMGYPRAEREGRLRGTGMLLNGVEDFVRLTESAPVAPHFGDFVLGFPAAVENTQYALQAGCTAIGNLGPVLHVPSAGMGRRCSDHRAHPCGLGADCSAGSRGSCALKSR